MELVIKNTGKGFEWYGTCEACGKRCDNHYLQGQIGGNYVIEKKFGHLHCLQSGLWKNAAVINN